MQLNFRVVPDATRLMQVLGSLQPGVRSTHVSIWMETGTSAGVPERRGAVLQVALKRHVVEL